jgi:hypothetical protein
MISGKVARRALAIAKEKYGDYCINGRTGAFDHWDIEDIINECIDLAKKEASANQFKMNIIGPGK